MVRRARQQVLLQLLQPARLSGLQQHEWDAEDLAATEAAGASTPPPQGQTGASGTLQRDVVADAAAASPSLPASVAASSMAAAAGGATVAPWVAPPLPIAAAVHAFAMEAASVSALLRAVDGVLGLPQRVASGAAHGTVDGTVDGGAAISVVELKMGHELHRFWVSALAAMSREGLGEDAAVATQLLLALRARVDSEITEVAAAAHAAARLDPVRRGDPEVVAAARAGARRDLGNVQAVHAHYSTLQHLLGLWGRGVEVPGLSTL